jgi:hypothetical protein
MNEPIRADFHAFCQSILDLQRKPLKWLEVATAAGLFSVLVGGYGWLSLGMGVYMPVIATVGCFLLGTTVALVRWKLGLSIAFGAVLAAPCGYALVMLRLHATQQSIERHWQGSTSPPWHETVLKYPHHSTAGPPGVEQCRHFEGPLLTTCVYCEGMQHLSCY